MKKIKAVLARYFECDFDGKPNQTYDPLFSAQEAIDAIVEIVKASERYNYPRRCGYDVH